MPANEKEDYMKLREYPELSPEEKKMPLSKYYNIPISPIDPIRQQVMNAGPMDPNEALKAENFLDLFNTEGYCGHELGYCMMPDGSGYMTIYEVADNPRVTPEMKQWYHNWINFYSKSMVPDQGNLRYKIWMPLDHIDHAYVNGKDTSGGVYSLETLDLGAGSRAIPTYRYRINPREYGLTEEMENKLKAAGCSISVSWESFDEPGSHFLASITRPCPLGGVETLRREWIGWRPENGRLVRDESTPCDEEFLKNIIIHNTMEHYHLQKFLPELYAEYKDQPIDAD